MLKGNKVIVFGDSSEIAQSIVSECLQCDSGLVYYVCSGKCHLEPDERLRIIEFDFYNYENHSVLISYIGKFQWDGFVFAGGKGGVRPIKFNSYDFVLDMFHSNVFTFFELVRLLVKNKLLNKGASIVALSSVSSVKGLKSKTVYSSSKAALDAAIKGMAAELSINNIRVNSIQKGWVTSDMNLDFIQSSIVISDSEDYKKQLLGPVKPSEIASLAVFLLSDKVQSITGTNIIIDGGYTI